MTSYQRIKLSNNWIKIQVIFSEIIQPIRDLAAGHVTRQMAKVLRFEGFRRIVNRIVQMLPRCVQWEAFQGGHVMSASIQWIFNFLSQSEAVERVTWLGRRNEKSEDFFFFTTISSSLKQQKKWNILPAVGQSGQRPRSRDSIFNFFSFPPLFGPSFFDLNFFLLLCARRVRRWTKRRLLNKSTDRARAKKKFLNKLI